MFLALLWLTAATPALSQQAEKLPPLCVPSASQLIDGQRVQETGQISIGLSYVSFVGSGGCALPVKLPLANPRVLQNAIFTARGYTRWIDERPAPDMPKGYWLFEIDTISDVTLLPNR